jgi:ribose transport system substrate-binding protein
MKKYWLFIPVICLLAGVLSSCKSITKKKENVVIAVIPKVDNEIFNQVKQSAMQAGEKLGITVTWEAPSSNDGAKQKELIENLIKYKVDGILISCNDEEILKEPINKAIKAGIKVGTFDSDCAKSDRLFYVGSDNAKAGVLCAQTMFRLFDKAKKKPQHVLVLSGGVNASNMKERFSGFQSKLGNDRIGPVVYTFEMAGYGEELLSMNLKKDKKIDGVQMIWGLPALKGVDSIPALLNFMKKGGIAVFFDTSKPLLKYIKENPNCATIKQDFHGMGYYGVQNMYNAIMKLPYEKALACDIKVIDQSNAGEELKDWK